MSKLCKVSAVGGKVGELKSTADFEEAHRSREGEEHGDAEGSDEKEEEDRVEQGDDGADESELENEQLCGSEEQEAENDSSRGRESTPSSEQVENEKERDPSIESDSCTWAIVEGQDGCSASKLEVNEVESREEELRLELVVEEDQEGKPKLCANSSPSDILSRTNQHKSAKRKGK